MISKLTPNLIVPDVGEAQKFYESLGFVTVVTVPDDGPPHFAILVCGAVELMLQSQANIAEDLPGAVSGDVGASVVLYMEVADVEAVHATLEGSSEIVMPLRSTFYGMREFYVRDPHGYVLGFAQKSGDVES